ncbi:Beta-barrel assembly-enhancing protease [termite gut metagenome]|uniref:Beta-barrel assembly-enhancing protease n=1 Tax=termite gut metagenome TaxID=433724 RepID=A0A5J4SZC5_9ZZZZ
MIIPKLRLCGGILLFAYILISCNSSYKLRRTAPSAIVVFSPEEQRKYDYFFLEAIRLKAKNEYDAAFDLFKHCLVINPYAPSALYETAQCYFFLQQNVLGEETLEKAVSYAPDNYWYNQALVNVYRQQDKKQKAAALLEATTKRFPNKHEILFELIDIYALSEEYDKVIHTLNRLEDKTGKTEQLSMEKFRIYLQMNNIERAFKEIESLTEEYPMNMHYLTMLGDVYLQNKKEKEALETYQKVLSIEPDNYPTLFSLAGLYKQTGQKEHYEGLLDSLLYNNEVSNEMKAGIMQYFFLESSEAKQDTVKLITIFDHLLEQNIENAQIPFLYAQYLLSIGKEEKAMPVFETVLQYEPDNASARATLLGYAIRKENNEQIIKICESGIEVSPQLPEYYYYLGIMYYQNDRPDDALAVYRKGLASISGNEFKGVLSEFYSMVGDIYFQKKRQPDAYMAYDSALVYNPDNIGALNNYAYYLSIERQDLDKAEEMSYKTIRKEPQNSTYLDTYAWILFEKKNYSDARIYIDDAMKNGGESSDIIVEHGGDIYYMNNDKEKALTYWLKAKEMGSKSKTLERKIRQKKYITE